MNYSFAFVASAYQGTLTILLSHSNGEEDGTRFIIWNPKTHDLPTLRGSRANNKPNGGFGKVDMPVIQEASQRVKKLIQAQVAESRGTGHEIAKLSQLVGQTFNLGEILSEDTTSDDLPF